MIDLGTYDALHNNLKIQSNSFYVIDSQGNLIQDNLTHNKAIRLCLTCFDSYSIHKHN
jgi:hypothetical protein